MKQAISILPLLFLLISCAKDRLGFKPSLNTWAESNLINPKSYELVRLTVLDTVTTHDNIDQLLARDQKNLKKSLADLAKARKSSKADSEKIISIHEKIDKYSNLVDILLGSRKYAPRQTGYVVKHEFKSGNKFGGIIHNTKYHFLNNDLDIINTNQNVITAYTYKRGGFEGIDKYMAAIKNVYIFHPK